MNYYEHHIGDYDEATSHLTACEDGIYSRLIRKYYSTEKPLTNDLAALQRLVRARTREEKNAVVAVLEEFFYLKEDGWHQKRCDYDLARFLASEPERELKKANEENRLKRHRDERAKLFKALTEAGLHAPWNIGIGELRDLASKIREATPATATETDASPLPATAPATPATATQTPDTTSHNPDDKDTPHNPPSAGADGGPESPPKRERKPRISLKTFIENCAKCGEKSISEYRPLLEYVEGVSLQMDLVQLCWEVFKAEFLPGGEKEGKLQADWRRHFLTYVKKGYYRLWYARPDGTFALTTQGIQAQRFHGQRDAA